MTLKPLKPHNHSSPKLGEVTEGRRGLLKHSCQRHTTIFNCPFSIFNFNPSFDFRR